MDGMVVLIGAVGIGGVLLPPALIRLGGFDPHVAAAAAPDRLVHAARGRVFLLLTLR